MQTEPQSKRANLFHFKLRDFQAVWAIQRPGPALSRLLFDSDARGGNRSDRTARFVRQVVSWTWYGVLCVLSSHVGGLLIEKSRPIDAPNLLCFI